MYFKRRKLEFENFESFDKRTINATRLDNYIKKTTEHLDILWM